MVNIRNGQIELLKELLNEYSNHTYSAENYFKYQDCLIDLENRMNKKKEYNKKQYEGRKFMTDEPENYDVDGNDRDAYFSRE